MATSPTAQPSGLQEAVNILTLITALEQAGIQLVKTLAENLSGKTQEQILAETDSIWDSVVTTAQQQLGITVTATDSGGACGKRFVEFYGHPGKGFYR